MSQCVRRWGENRSHRIPSSADTTVAPLVSYTRVRKVGKGSGRCWMPVGPIPSPNPAMLPPPSTSGSTGLCRRSWRKCLQRAQTCWNSHETDPKMGRKGFLPAEREWSKAYWGRRKPTHGVKGLWVGEPWWFDSGWTPSQDDPVGTGMSLCNALSGAWGRQFHLRPGF